MYILIPLVILMTVGALYIKISGAIKHMARASKSYRKSATPAATVEERTAIATGAINGEQLTAAMDSLETEIGKMRCMSNLNEAWEARTRGQVQSVLQWLMSEGHRVYFDDVVALAATDKKTWKKAVAGKEDAEKLLEYAGNWVETQQSLRDAGMVDEAAIRRGIVAWDMARANNIARMAFDAGYIDRATAWSAVNASAAECYKAYGSWKELAAGYMLGRAMWSGEGVMLDGLLGISKGLLEDEASPWKSLTWPRAKAA